MIQRIQTIYLAIALICMGLTLIFPFSTYGDIEFNAMGFNNDFSIASSYPLIYNIIVSTILSLLAIFSFKNRKNQQLINKLNFVVILILLVVMFIDFNYFQSIPMLNENVSYGIGMFLPIVALVSLIMAYRAIKSDEDLIKSMDRIR
mgnify:CR=1 FL=1